eukprot:1670939-Rhodomonas_salina.2
MQGGEGPPREGRMGRANIWMDMGILAKGEEEGCRQQERRNEEGERVADDAEEEREDGDAIEE